MARLSLTGHVHLKGNWDRYIGKKKGGILLYLNEQNVCSLQAKESQTNKKSSSILNPPWLWIMAKQLFKKKKKRLQDKLSSFILVRVKSTPMFLFTVKILFTPSRGLYEPLWETEYQK